MRNVLRTAACLSAGFVFAYTCFAQEEKAKPDSPPPRFYRLDFVVKELENDKVINSRAYATSTAANTQGQAAIRAGSRVPYATGSPTAKQVQYYDVGVNIDVLNPRELPSGQLTLYLEVDLSNALVTKEGSGDAPPVVRQNKWRSPVVVQIKKTTTVFSSDDPSGNRKMQLDLTATPISN
jgi:hypothetical protein